MGMRWALLLLAAGAMGELVEVTMRDGFKLSTAVDCKGDTPQTVIFERSTYTHYATELIADVVAEALGEGFCAVRQDMRGSGFSVGQDFTLWHAGANDTYDTLAWMAKQPWSNGKVLQTGVSSDGLGAFTGILDKPAQLQGQFVMYASVLAWGLAFPGGAYREGLQDGWLKDTFPLQHNRLRKLSRAHEAPGAWWDPVNVTKANCAEVVRFPAVLLAGWYDIFLHGNLAGYDCYKQDSHPKYLMVEPCGHCGLQPCPLYELDSLHLVTSFYMALDIFAGRPIPEDIKHVTFFVMGASRLVGETEVHGNFWTTLDSWPQYKETAWYLTPDGGLREAAPEASTPRTIIYNPANPVPTVGGGNMILKCGPLDQTDVEKRDDVLVHTSEVLKEPLAVTGPLDVILYVTSNCTDTDFTAKLTDVYPNGQSRLIQDGIVRMRWRAGEHGGVYPQLIKPGEEYQVRISLWNTSYVFSPGHRIRVSVSSSNAPRFEPNPNTGKPLSDEDGTMIIANNTVLVGGSTPSRIILPVVPLSALPKWNMSHTLERWLDNRPPSYRKVLSRITPRFPFYTK